MSKEMSNPRNCPYRALQQQMNDRRKEGRVAKREFAKTPGSVLNFSKSSYEVMPNGSYKKIESNE